MPWTYSGFECSLAASGPPFPLVPANRDPPTDSTPRNIFNTRRHPVFNRLDDNDTSLARALSCSTSSVVCHDLPLYHTQLSHA